MLTLYPLPMAIKESLPWQSFPLKILQPVELATIILFLISFQKPFGRMVMLDTITA